MDSHRKLEVTARVKAIKWTGDNLREVVDFAGLHPSANKWTWEEYESVVSSRGLKIFTRDGPSIIFVGDMITKNDVGELSFYDPSVFDAMYKPREELVLTIPRFLRQHDD